MNYPILQSLAYLKINSEDGQSKIFLDNFIPFIVESLKEHKDAIINLQLLQDIVKEKFGITIPQNVIKAILHRSRKEGYVSYNNSNHYKNENKIMSFAFTAMQSRVERIYSALLTGLVLFAKEQYQVSILETNAESLLLSFISYYQINFYQAEEVHKRLLEDSGRPDKNLRYIVASFILDAKNRNPQIYEYIEVIVKGFMIAQVLYLPDAHQTKKRFTKTRVFLDTSFIIYALGYGGVEFKNSSTELLELLYKNNAFLCCFEHTVEEIEGILLACSIKLGSYSNGAFGRTLRYFQSIGDTPFDIRLKISHLRRNIENLNIKIMSIPEYSDDKFFVNETELFNLLKESMASQSKDEAIYRDVASISAIYRYRKNERTNFIENSTALFVTTSSTLANVSNEDFYKHNDKDLAPPCVTDYSLTNILWLKSPNQSPKLPMKRIIADAFAAVQPSDALMEKWLSEVSRMKSGEPVSEEDYYFMRSSEEVYTSLMKHTLGDPRTVTSDKVRTIVQSARDKIRLQVEERFKPELIDRQKSILELKKQLDLEALEKNNRKERRKVIAHKVAKIIITGFEIILFMILLSTIILQLLFGSSNDFEVLVLEGNYVLTFLIGLGLLIFVVLTIITNYFGVPIPVILRPLELWLENTIYRKLESISNKI